MSANQGMSRKTVRWLMTATLLVMGAAPLGAQILANSTVSSPPIWSSDPTLTGTNDWDDWKRNCSSMAHDFGKDTLFSCGTSTFRSRPFHFLAQTVVPGSAVGGGGDYGRDLNSDIWQRRLELKGVLTIREFWLTEAKFTAQRPHF